MSKPFKFFIVIAIIIIGMISTNPTKQDFVEKATTMLQSEVSKSTGDGIIGAFAAGVVQLVGDEIIDAATTRVDFTICSMYTVSLPDSNQKAYLGIFGFFVPLN